MNFTMHLLLILGELYFHVHTFKRVMNNVNNNLCFGCQTGDCDGS